MKMESGDFCPLVNGPCKKFECKWWIQVRGIHPQTGQEVDEWDCTISFLPMLLIENSQQQRQTGAAVESFRNETISRISQTISMKTINEPMNELEGDREL